MFGVSQHMHTLPHGTAVPACLNDFFGNVVDAHFHACNMVRLFRAQCHQKGARQSLLTNSLCLIRRHGSPLFMSELVEVTAVICGPEGGTLCQAQCCFGSEW